MLPLLDQLTTPICLSRPPRSGATTRILEHLPFAMNLVALLRPRTVVTLGTASGELHAALRQAIAETGLPTSLQRGGGEPATEIDLLCVEEPAAARLDAWLPGLSARGVVLAHGIGVAGSQLARGWTELARRHPSFELPYGDGLGVLAPEPPEVLRPLLGASAEDAALVTTFFRELGRRLVAESRLAVLEADVGRLEGELREAHATLEAIANSKATRLANRYRRLRDRLLAPGSPARRLLDHVAGRPPAVEPVDYESWLRRHAPAPAELARLRARVGALPARPLVSVLTPVHDVDEPWLCRCIDSVRAQLYDRWELCLVDDGSTRPHVARVLAAYAARDPRIRVERLDQNVGIGAASARALAMARGAYVAFLDHDDELTPDALARVVELLAERPELDLVYSDEDKLELDGRRVEPFFKPDWSPTLLLSMNYICHLSVLRRSVLLDAGGFRPGFDGSQDYDLFLRVTERTSRIAHIPRVLYHWRKVPGSAAAAVDAKSYAFDAAQNAIAEAVARRGGEARVVMTRPGLYSVRPAIKGMPTVSIVMPTRDRPELLRAAVGSIEQRSSWPHRELLVVDNGTTDPTALALLDRLPPRARVLRHPGAFNWSAINNRAAREARGELLLFLNNDVEVIAGDWLEALIEQAQRPEVGVVGAKLLYPTRTIQHAGVVLGIGGVANHGFKHLPAGDCGYFGLPLVIRDCSAVTGACMMVRRELFEELGGFDEALGVAFNDVDFCLRVRARGLAVIYTPHALLYHHESASRGDLHPPENEQLMRRRWGEALARDPFYNPNLTLSGVDYGLRL